MPCVTNLCGIIYDWLIINVFNTSLTDQLPIINVFNTSLTDQFPIINVFNTSLTDQLPIINVFNTSVHISSSQVKLANTALRRAFCISERKKVSANNNCQSLLHIFFACYFYSWHIIVWWLTESVMCTNYILTIGYIMLINTWS